MLTRSHTAVVHVAQTCSTLLAVWRVRVCRAKIRAPVLISSTLTCSASHNPHRRRCARAVVGSPWPREAYGMHRALEGAAKKASSRLHSWWLRWRACSVLSPARGCTARPPCLPVRQSASPPVRPSAHTSDLHVFSKEWHGHARRVQRSSITTCAGGGRSWLTLLVALQYGSLAPTHTRAAILVPPSCTA